MNKTIANLGTRVNDLTEKDKNSGLFSVMVEISWKGKLHMLNFIYSCMAVMVLSFFIVPVFGGISNEYQTLEQSSQFAESSISEDTSLSFEEIYALADEAAMRNPAFLNEIAPAAGDDIAAPVEGFSSGFSSQGHPAL